MAANKLNNIETYLDDVGVPMNEARLFSMHGLSLIKNLFFPDKYLEDFDSLEENDREEDEEPNILDLLGDQDEDILFKPTEFSFLYNEDEYDEECDEMGFWHNPIKNIEYGFGFFERFYDDLSEFKKLHPNGETIFISKEGHQLGPFLSLIETIAHSIETVLSILSDYNKGKGIYLELLEKNLEIAMVKIDQIQDYLFDPSIEVE